MFEPVRHTTRDPSPEVLATWARLEAKSPTAAHDLRLRYHRRHARKVSFQRIPATLAVKIVATAAEAWWRSLHS